MARSLEPLRSWSDDPIVRAVARHALPGTENAPPPLSGWERALPLIAAQGLAGLALDLLARCDRPAPASLIDGLQERHRGDVVHVARLITELVRLLDRLRPRGIRPVVLKGPAVAQTAYRRSSWRPYSDLDLLVAPDERFELAAALRASGFDRHRPPPRPGFDERFAKAVVHRRPDGLEFDVHRALADGPVPLRIPLPELLQHATTLPIGDRTARRLDDTRLFLHACIHAALGDPSPRALALRDVAQIAWSMDVRWDLADALAERWRLHAVVRHAIVRAAGRLDVGLPEAAGELAGRDVTRRDARVLAAYVTDRRYRGARQLEMLRALPGIHERAAYAAALLLPRRDFLTAREGAVRHPAAARLRRLTRAALMPGGSR